MPEATAHARGIPLILSVTTLGRVESLRTLLGSLADQLGPDDRVVLVAQARFAEVDALVREFREEFGGRLIMTTSERGASLGRNTGVWAATEGVDDALVMFPNDTTWFPADSVAAIRAAMVGAAAGAVAVVTSAGPRFVLPPAGSPLDVRSVWAVIEMGLVIHLPLFRALGGFNEAIGTGARTPWQAGEVTDLLMRALQQDPSLAGTFRWITDLAAAVGGVTETAGLTTLERRRKIRGYGRGVGHVFRAHPFPRWHRVRFAVGGALIGVLRRREYRLSDGPAAFTGRLEGLRGMTFAESGAHAVDR